MSQSLWRTYTYKKLANETLDGSIIDLGGSRRSRYHGLLGGDHTISVNNLEEVAATEGNDYSFDLEETFPIADNEFDHVLCINVLEHIYNYKQLLAESHRIMKPGGSMVVAVPFLIQFHPSPNDFWRYTETTLERIFTEAGFTDIVIEPLGTGVFGAGYSMIHNALKFSILQFIGKSVALSLDWFLGMIKPGSFLSKRYYVLGYYVTAKKR